VTVLFDTNIVIDVMRGIPEAMATIRAYRTSSISIVTRIELLAGPTEDVPAVRAMLERFRVIPLDNPIADATAIIRRNHRLKLLDAVILASAQIRGLTLITRDERDFSGLAEVHIPYRL
jgi:hypothetical protein